MSTDQFSLFRFFHEYIFNLGPGEYDVQAADRGPAYSFGVKLPTAAEKCKFSYTPETTSIHLVVVFSACTLVCILHMYCFVHCTCIAEK